MFGTDHAPARGMAYYIIGAAGEQHGPMTLDQLNELVRTNRLDAGANILDTDRGAEYVAFTLPGLLFSGRETYHNRAADSARPYVALTVYPNEETHIVKTIGLFFVSLMATVLTPCAFLPALVALLGVWFSLKTEKSNATHDPFEASRSSVVANEWGNWAMVALLVAMFLYLTIPAFMAAL